jgi:uncharacterized protein YkwD
MSRVERRRGRLPLAAFAVALAASALFAVPASAACPNADLVPSAANLEQVRAATLCLLNEQRAHHGVRPLAFEASLQRAAQAHSGDMVARRYFSHTTLGGPALIPRLLASGYHVPGRPYRFGEALGWAGGAGATPRLILARVLSSSLHRGYLFGALFTHVGIGVAVGTPFGGAGATYVFDVGWRG